MIINSIQEAENILRNYVLNAHQVTGDDLSLVRMFPMLEILGNPHDKLKVIHIAGTSGKTSTAYFISSILSNSGAKVGLTVSPHVDSITERVQINLKPLSELIFSKYLGEFLDLISGLDQKPSYFEILIAFVYWVFAKEHVDYAVIETGMGGLLDSTNVAGKTNKICVITDIGLDHMHVLGNNLSEIAFQKAGIIHSQNNVFMYKQSNEVMDQLGIVIKDKNAVLYTIPDFNLQQSEILKINAPLFQKRNWNLAKNVCLFISNRDNLLLNNSVNDLTIKVPGRMDTFELSDGAILIMDGAHNGQKVSTFVTSFKDKYHNQKATVLLAVKSGKEYKEVIDNLSDIAESFIFTTFSTSQDLPAVAIDPKILKSYSDYKNIPSIIIFEHELAFKKLLQAKSQIKLVIGSFYLLGQVRKHFL